MTESLQQTQTLSLRISEALRKRLEDLRKLRALRKGESVSTSEIAKQLLESAREDRFEVVELLGRPTEALVEIRQKGEAGQMLTRAEWTTLAYYVQQGAEAFTKNPLSRESYTAILKAFEAAHRLRGKASNLDEYYLGNLPTECRPERSARSEAVTAELVRQVTAETVRRLNQAATKWAPVFAARNLFVLLDEEKLAGAAALNEALLPYWPALWRVAARGHYYATGEPVRGRGRLAPPYQPAIPSLAEGGYKLSFARGEAGELSMLLSFPGVRGPLYPLGRYPVIAEFRAMATTFPADSRREQYWNGEHFFGYVSERGKETEVWFRAHANGIAFGFTAQEWKAVRDLFRHAWENAEVRMSWDALSLEYGEM